MGRTSSYIVIRLSLGSAGAGDAVAGDEVAAGCEAVAPGVAPRAGATDVAVDGASVVVADGVGAGTGGATGVEITGAGEDDGMMEPESALLDAGFEPGLAGNEGCNAGLAAAVVDAASAGGRAGVDEAGAVVATGGAEASAAGVAMAVGPGAGGGVGVGIGVAVAFAWA